MCIRFIFKHYFSFGTDLDETLVHCALDSLDRPADFCIGVASRSHVNPKP